MGSVQKRVFIFGGKEPTTKEITNKAYEIIQNREGIFEMKKINRMFKNRTRTAIACINYKIAEFSPFIVIIGGSDQY